MAVLRRTAALLLLPALLLALAPGCGGGSAPQDPSWKRDVDGSLQSLEGLRSLHYRMHVETWIGVSGQSVYGDERSEGSYLEGGFSVTLVRTSPAGEENLVFSSQAGGLYLLEGETWSSVTPAEAPSPLYDPKHVAALLSSYGEVSLQGEEELSGAVCRRYFLRLGEGRAREALTESAWSYFSSLRFELNCTLWVSDPSTPPSSLRLEIIGLDPQESLQRYRCLVTMDLCDFDSPVVLPVSPGE